MAAKLEDLEYFYGIDKLDRAFSDSAGRLAAMHLGFTPKKPDKVKVQELLTKAKQTLGNFGLVLDGLKLTFEIRAGEFKAASPKIVLNTLDLGTIRDIAKRRELLFQLSQRTDLVTDKDLAAFDEEHTEPANPAVQKASVELGKEIDKIERELDNLKSVQSAPNYKKTEYSQWDTEFNDWVDKKGFGRFTAFIQDVDKGSGLGPKASELLADPKTSGIQPKTLAAINAATGKGEKPDFAQASKEVTHVVNTMMLPRYNKERLADIAAQIKTLTAQLEALKKKLQALETK